MPPHAIMVLTTTLHPTLVLSSLQYLAKLAPLSALSMLDMISYQKEHDTHGNAS
jgi:hypothetical protein